MIGVSVWILLQEARDIVSLAAFVVVRMPESERSRSAPGGVDCDERMALGQASLESPNHLHTTY